MSSFHSLKQIKVLDRSPQGEGAFSKVFKVQHREDNKVYALKQIDILQLSKADCDNLKLEIQLHKKLKHDNIISFRGCLQRKNLVYMLLEQAANGSLFFYIDLNEGLPELLALRFLYETAKGIEYLHQNRIVHRDIKPENILLDHDFRVKVCDFGWSCKIEDQEVRSSICGTYEYMSPEIVYEQSHNFGVDVWCLGILLYEMLHGSPPFKAESLKQIKKEFKNRKIRVSKNFDKDTQSLINQLLQYDSRKRISVSQLLQHRAIVKNLRHFNRKLTQEEFNLMRKYYFMNAGGVNLDCHNSVYARQLKRQSQLSRVDNHDPDGFVNLNISQDFGDEAAGLRFPSPENGKPQINRSERVNDFQPKKFMTPISKDGGKGANFNQFQPKNFFAKSEISPLQNHPQMAANAFKRKKESESGNINQYNPPAFVNKTNKNENKKRGKSEKNIKIEKSGNQRKNSSLKQKLRIQRMKESNTNINSFNPTNNYRKQSTRERGRNKNLQTSFSRQISDLKKSNQLIERRKQAALNRSRQEPVSNRVIRSASSNPALLSHSSTRFGNRIRQEQKDLKSSQRKIQPTLTKNKHTKSQTANLWSKSGRRITQDSGNSGKAQNNIQANRSNNRSRDKGRKVYHREDSVSVERALASRVVKNSSSLPKKLFGLKRSSGKTNLTTRKVKQKEKMNLRVLNLVKQGNGLFNQKFGVRDGKNNRNLKSGTQRNFKNNTSINYKADEVIKEEKYLSDFQNVKTKFKKQIENKPINRTQTTSNNPLKLQKNTEISKISDNPNLKLLSKTESQISKNPKSLKDDSKTNISSRLQKSKITNPKINISMISKDNQTSRVALPSQNSILIDRNYVSSVSYSTSFLNTTQFGQGNNTQNEKNYASVSNYLSNQELKKSPMRSNQTNSIGSNILSGLDHQNKNNNKDQKTEPDAERTQNKKGMPDLDVPTNHQERFVKTTGSSDLKTHLQQAREEIKAMQHQNMTKGKSMFLNYDFDSKEHNQAFDGLRHSDLDPRPNSNNVKILQSSQSTTTLRPGQQVVRKKAFQNFSKDNKNNHVQTQIQEQNKKPVNLQLTTNQTGNLSKINEENYSLEMTGMTRTIEDKNQKKDFSRLKNNIIKETRKDLIQKSSNFEAKRKIERSRSRQKLPNPRKSEDPRKNEEKEGKHKRNHSMVKRTVIINGVKTERLILSKNHPLFDAANPNPNSSQNKTENFTTQIQSRKNSKLGNDIKQPIKKEIKVKSANRANEKSNKKDLISNRNDSRKNNAPKFGESHGRVKRILKANRSQKILRKVNVNESPEKKPKIIPKSELSSAINKSDIKEHKKLENPISRHYNPKFANLSELERAKKRISSVNTISISQALNFGITKKDDINSLINKVQKIEPGNNNKSKEIKSMHTTPKLVNKSRLEKQKPEARRFTNFESHMGVNDYANLGKNIKSPNFVSNRNQIETQKRFENQNDKITLKIESNPNEDISNFQSLRSPTKVKILNDNNANFFPNQSNRGQDSQKRHYNAVRFEDSFSFPHWENNLPDREGNEEISGSILKGLNSIQDTPQSKSNHTSRRATQNSNFYKKDDSTQIMNSDFQMQKPQNRKEMVQSNLLEGKAKKNVNIDNSVRTEKKISEKSIETFGGKKKLYQKKNMAMLIKGEYQASNRFNRWNNYQFSKKKGNNNILNSPQVISSKRNISKKLDLDESNRRTNQRGRLTERSTRNPHLSVNIKQLPGLKESISMDKLTTKRHLNQIKRTPSTRKIIHHKNMSMDVSKIHQRAKLMENFSTRGRSKRLQKTVDNEGNVRYKLVSKENSPVQTEKEIEQKVSIRRSEVRFNANEFEKSEEQREPKRSERLERDSEIERSHRAGRSITSRLKILNRRKISKKSEHERQRSNRSNSRIVVRRIRRKDS